MQTQNQTEKTYQHNIYPDERGRFGDFGGKFVPESLMAALAELEAAYEESRTDEAFQKELRSQLSSFVGRPTTLHYVPRFSDAAHNVMWLVARQSWRVASAVLSEMPRLC